MWKGGIIMFLISVGGNTYWSSYDVYYIDMYSIDTI